MIRMTIDGTEILGGVTNVNWQETEMYTAEFDIPMAHAAFWELYRRLFPYETPLSTLLRRAQYGGRKGRRAWRRLTR